MRRFATALAILGVTLAAVFVLRPRTGSSVELDGRMPVEIVDEPIEELATLEGEGEVRSPLGATAPPGESHRTNVVWSGLVIDRSGDPIPGATLSWAPILHAPSGRPLDWREISFDQLLQSSAWTESDSSGLFAFADAPDTLDGSVLWVTHPSHEAAYVVFAPGEGPDDLRSIELVERPVRTVTVVTGGEPVGEALVRQLADPVGASSQEEQARGSFCRESRADSFGRASLAPLPCPEGLVASRDDLRSKPQAGSGSGDVVIELLNAFQASGLVSLAGGDAVPDGASVRYEAKVGDEFELLGECDVHPDGTWGPVAIPLMRPQGYRFSVNGGGVVRKAIELPAPRRAESVTVDFETMLGVSQWFSVIDARTEQPLNEAKIEVHWRDEDGSWTSIDAYTREDGYIKVDGCRPGTIWYLGRYPGYAFRRDGPEVVPGDPPQTFQLALEPAGRIEGRCVFRGAPVTDFEVLYWPGDKVTQLWNDAWADREDGTFVLESVPAGEVCLVAHGGGHGQSELARIAVDPGGVTEVVLELSAAHDGAGRVVDQVSGEPVRGATVQLYATRGARPIYKTGLPTTTDADGYFEIGGLSEGGSTFRITADGYAARSIPVTPSAGTHLEFGRIALPRAQALEVRLYLPEDDDPTQYRVRTVAQGLPLTSFSADGTVKVAEFTAGAPAFEVVFPNGETLVKRTELVPGVDWVVDIPLDGACRLALEVVPGEGSDLPPGLWADVRLATMSGAIERTTSVPESGRLHFEHLDPGIAYVAISSHTGTVAGETITLLSGQQTTTRVSLDQDEYRFRVVDVHGTPLASTVVRFSVGGSEVGRLGGTTDAQGELRSAGVSSGTLGAHLAHPRLGVATHVPVQLPADPQEPVLLEFVSDTRLSASLSDGSEAAFGLSCQLFAHDSPFAVGIRKMTDAGGRVQWAPLSQGSYDLQADHPDFWPLRASLATGVEHRVQVRRRGHLSLTVTGSDGVPRANAPLSLWSVEFDIDVQTWVDAGEVRSSSARLVTDSAGSLRLSGLPHGEYDWAASPPGGSLHRGRLHVPRHGTGEVTVVLP